MMSFLRNLFGRRRSRFSNFRSSVLTPRGGGIGLGTLAALAAPFIIRRMRARRAEQSNYGAAY
jgi:hypothetical protein